MGISNNKPGPGSARLFILLVGIWVGLSSGTLAYASGRTMGLMQPVMMGELDDALSFRLMRELSWPTQGIFPMRIPVVVYEGELAQTGLIRRTNPALRIKGLLEEVKRMAQARRYAEVSRWLKEALTLALDAPASVADSHFLEETYLGLAEAALWQGLEDECRVWLGKLLMVNPALVLNLDQYPPAFINLISEVRREVLNRERGSLTVHSPEENADVFVDGQRVGTVPVVIEGLVAGPHVVAVFAPTGELWAEWVEVPKGSNRAVVSFPKIPATEDRLHPRKLLAANHFPYFIREMTLRNAQRKGFDEVVVWGIFLRDGSHFAGGVIGYGNEKRWRKLRLLDLGPNLELTEATRLKLRKWFRGDCTESVQYLRGKDHRLIPTLQAGATLNSLLSPHKELATYAWFNAGDIQDAREAMNLEQLEDLILLGTSRLSKPPLSRSMVNEEKLFLEDGSASYQGAERREMVVVQVESEPWYKKWWFWTAVGVIGVSAGVAGITTWQQAQAEKRVQYNVSW